MRPRRPQPIAGFAAVLAVLALVAATVAFPGIASAAGQVTFGPIHATATFETGIAVTETGTAPAGV